MNIGIITYSQYEERVLMDRNFVTDDLLNMVQNDKEYRKFQVVDSKGDILLSTDFRDTEQGAKYLEMAKIEKEVEQIGVVYDAFKAPFPAYRYKTTWKVNGGICNGKRHAELYSRKVNHGAKILIEQFIIRK